MTSEQAREFLFSKFETIRRKVIQHYMKSTVYGIANKSCKTERLEIFENLLGAYLMRHLNQYKVPVKTDSLFNLLLDGIESFKRNQYRNLFKYAERTFMTHNPEMMHIASFSELGSDEDNAYSGGDILDYLIEKDSTEHQEEMRQAQEDRDLNEELRLSNCQFMKYLSRNEETIFEAMQGYYSYAEALRIVQQHKPLFTRERLNAMRYRIEYRLISWYAAHEILEETKLLEAFNGHPNYNVRFHGQRILQRTPDKDDCKEIATGERPFIYKKEEIDNKFPLLTPEKLRTCVSRYDNTAVSCNVEGFVYKSRKDAKGKKHNHYIVFINKYGYCYDHVTKRTFLLPELKKTYGRDTKNRS